MVHWYMVRYGIHEMSKANNQRLPFRFDLFETILCRRLVPVPGAPSWLRNVARASIEMGLCLYVLRVSRRFAHSRAYLFRFGRGLRALGRPYFS